MLHAETVARLVSACGSWAQVEVLWSASACTRDAICHSQVPSSVGFRFGLTLLLLSGRSAGSGVVLIGDEGGGCNPNPTTLHLNSVESAWLRLHEAKL